MRIKKIKEKVRQIRKSNPNDIVTDGGTFPQLMLWTCNLGHLKYRTTGETFFLNVCMDECVCFKSIISQILNTWQIKSTFNISFSNTLCFVLIFSLFYLMLHFVFAQYIILAQKGHVKLCDGDYAIKKETGSSVLLSGHTMLFML